MEHHFRPINYAPRGAIHTHLGIIYDIYGTGITYDCDLWSLFTIVIYLKYRPLIYLSSPSLALAPLSIRHRWKCLPLTNTLAYYGTELSIAVKRFMIYAPERHEIKYFWHKLWNCVDTGIISIKTLYRIDDQSVTNSNDTFLSLRLTSDIKTSIKLFNVCPGWGTNPGSLIFFNSRSATEPQQPPTPNFS